MLRLIRGIIDFRKKLLPADRELFAQLALGQKPDALLITCSDSRVAPNVFASADPGDMFVVRNVGNLISPSGKTGLSTHDVSEAAAIEFSLVNLPVKDIIVCGHSECGAMCAMMEGRSHIHLPNLRNWLKHAEPSLKRLNEGETLDEKIAKHNQLSQLNVLQQIEHLMTYPLVKERVEAGTLKLHGWWFDIGNADVYGFDDEAKKFVIIDNRYAERFQKRFLLQQAEIMKKQAVALSRAESSNQSSSKTSKKRITSVELNV